MRFTPRVGRKAWFGPRGGGWGWDPASWEGWASMAAFVVGLAVVSSSLEGYVEVAAIVACVAAFVAVIVLKGTSPGGPEAADRFREVRHLLARTPEEIEADRVRRRLTEDEPSVAGAAERLKQVPKRPGAP